MSTLGLRLLSRDQIFDTINRGRVNATTCMLVRKPSDERKYLGTLTRHNLQKWHK